MNFEEIHLSVVLFSQTTKKCESKNDFRTFILATCSRNNNNCIVNGYQRGLKKISFVYPFVARQDETVRTNVTFCGKQCLRKKEIHSIHPSIASSSSYDESTKVRNIFL